jgi:hypothetical protein
MQYVIIASDGAIVKQVGTETNIIRAKRLASIKSRNVMTVVNAVLNHDMNIDNITFDVYKLDLENKPIHLFEIPVKKGVKQIVKLTIASDE